MKSGMLRLTRSWLFWFLVLFQLAFIVVYSINYCKDGTTNKERWYHGIMEYNDTELLIGEQIKNVEEQIYYLEESSNNNEDIDAIRNYYVETIEILKYLQKHNYDYCDVQEAEVVYYHEEDKRAYTLQIMEVLLWMNVVISIILLGLIVNSGKTNGAIVFEVLIKGRKRLFMKEGKLYFMIMTLFLAYQIILVTALNMQFPVKSKYILHYNGGDIKVISQSWEYVWAVVSLIISLYTVYILHFALSQLIGNIFTFSIVAITVTVVVKYLLAYTSTYKFLLAFNVTMNNIYENGLSPGFYAFAIVTKYLLAIVMLYLTYRYCMRRKIRTYSN